MTSPDESNIAAVFDLDGTLTTVDTYVEFLRAALGRWPARWVPALALPVAASARWLGWRDNTWLKTVALSAILAGKQRKELGELAASFAARVERDCLRPAARPTLEAHRHRGHRLVLASASLDFYVEEIAARLGFDHTISTRTAWDQRETLLPTLGSKNCFGHEKAARISALLAENQLANQWIFYSDHIRDLPALAAANIAVAVNPNSNLANAAGTRNFLIQNWDDPKASEASISAVMAALAAADASRSV